MNFSKRRQDFLTLFKTGLQMLVQMILQGASDDVL